jgi:hypothetical protein
MIWNCVDSVHPDRDTESWHSPGLSADLTYEAIPRYAHDVLNDFPLISKCWFCYKLSRGEAHSLVFFSNPTTCPYRLRGPPPGCGRSVTDFWCWGAHSEHLICPDDVSDDLYERAVPGGSSNLNYTGYPYHGRYGDLPLQGKIPTAESEIEPRNSWLVVRSSDHQTTRLVALLNFCALFWSLFILFNWTHPLSH